MHLFMNVFAIFLAKFFDLLLLCPSLYVAIIVYKEKPRFRFILLLCFIIALLDEYFMTMDRMVRNFNMIVATIGAVASLSQVYVLIGLKKLKDKSSEFFDKRRENTDSH